MHSQELDPMEKVSSKVILSRIKVEYPQFFVDKCIKKIFKQVVFSYKDHLKY